jgi:hypothetical protein
MTALAHYKSTVATWSYQHDLIDVFARRPFYLPLRNAAVAKPRCQGPAHRAGRRR